MVESFINIYILLASVGLVLLILALSSLSTDGYTPFGNIRSTRVWGGVGIITTALIVVGMWGIVVTQPYYETRKEAEELEQ